MDERDLYLKINLVEKMTDKETVEDLYANEPFVLDLLVENFKSFFSDKNFKKLERQLTLLKFLKNDYPLEISRKIVSYVENCEFAEDYRKIIMEWNYQCSEYIKQEALREYDEQLLTLSKQDKSEFDYLREINRKKLNFIDDVTRLLTGESEKEK